MTYTTPEIPSAAPKTPDQIQEETRAQLAKAKLENFLKLSPLEMIQNYLNERPKLTPDQRREWIKAMVFTIFFLKLGKKINPKASDQRDKESDEAGAKTPADAPDDTSAVPDTANPPSEGKRGDQPASPPAVDQQRYAKGDLIPAIVGLYPGVEVQGGLQTLNTAITTRAGVPKWGKKTTDDWDYAKAGNTDEGIEKGEYHIQSDVEPSGYTRSGADSVPEPTKAKLVRIAQLLRADSRMPLFTGIAMTIDGVQVMFVKEIHIHDMREHGKSRLADYYFQPHTGVSYIMKRA